MSWLKIGEDEYNVYKMAPVGKVGWLIAGFTGGHDNWHGDRLRAVTFVKEDADLRNALMEMAKNATN